MSHSENKDAAQAKYGNLIPYVKGQSGNPGGRPKGNAALRHKCRELTDELIERLRVLARGADNDAASVAAIKLLLAYGHGAPESKPLEDDDAQESQGGKVTPIAALKALDAAPLTPEPRGPDDTDH
jgi:hypothetical protein